MNKTYKIKPTRKQLATLKKGWKLFQAINDTYYESISDLEGKLSKETGIEEIEFIHDNMCMGWSGIGNGTRTIRLFQRSELEK